MVMFATRFGQRLLYIGKPKEQCCSLWGQNWNKTLGNSGHILAVSTIGAPCQVRHAADDHARSLVCLQISSRFFGFAMAQFRSFLDEFWKVGQSAVFQQWLDMLWWYFQNLFETNSIFYQSFRPTGRLTWGARPLATVRVDALHRIMLTLASSRCLKLLWIKNLCLCQVLSNLAQRNPLDDDLIRGLLRVTCCVAGELDEAPTCFYYM